MYFYLLVKYKLEEQNWDLLKKNLVKFSLKSYVKRLQRFNFVF